MVDTIDAICLKEHPGQQKTNLRARTVEMGLYRKESVNEGEFWKQVAHLFNVARMPHRYPDVTDRPARALKGGALLSWIAVRVGVTNAEVRLLLY